MSDTSDFEWERLRRLASDFELLLTQAPTMTIDDFTQLTHAVLARLISLGTAMPSLAYIHTGTGGKKAWQHRDEQQNPRHDRWMVDWRDNYEALTRFLGASDSYFAVPDPSKGECESSTLSDDLADVLADLKAGAYLYDESRLAEAMWEWRFRFRHWGAHALAAMQVLHSRINWDEA